MLLLWADPGPWGQDSTEGKMINTQGWMERWRGHQADVSTSEITSNCHQNQHADFCSREARLHWEQFLKVDLQGQVPLYEVMIGPKDRSPVTRGKGPKSREVASIRALHCQEKVLHSHDEHSLSTRYVLGTGSRWKTVPDSKEPWETRLINCPWGTTNCTSGTIGIDWRPASTQDLQIRFLMSCSAKCIYCKGRKSTGDSWWLYKPTSTVL